MTTAMRETLQQALTAATRSQDRRRMCTLRLIMAALKDRDIEARTVGREPTSDEELLQLLQKMVKQRQESAVIYENAGRLDLSEQEREEIAIISEYMPAQLDDCATRQAVAEVIRTIEAQGLRDMGRTMNTLKERYAGQMDFSRACVHAKALLA